MPKLRYQSTPFFLPRAYLPLLNVLWLVATFHSFNPFLQAADQKTLIEMDRTFEIHLALQDDLILSVDNNGFCSWKPAKTATPARFKFVVGLANPNLVSLQSVDLPGHVLRHLFLRLRVMPEPLRADRLFEDDATFEVKPGPDGLSLSLRSFNMRDAFIGSSHRKKAYIVPDPAPEDYALTIVYQAEKVK